MSDAGQPSERVPDFIPGWFAPREGNPDPAIREAVRVPIVGDHFPITFLRSNERVNAARRPQLGFTVGPTSQSGHDPFDLAVPPGYWIVRNPRTGHLANWRDEDFKAKFTRTDRPWTAAVDRESNAAALDEMIAAGPPAVSEVAPITPRGCSLVDNPYLPEGQGWRGESPAEGTRRCLIRDTIGEFGERLGYGGAQIRDRALEIADEVEAAFLKIDIGADPTGETSPASKAMSVLDGMGIPRTDGGKILTIENRVVALADDHVELRRRVERLDQSRFASPIAPSPIHDQLDRAGIDRMASKLDDGPRRILTLAERVELLIRRYKAANGTDVDRLDSIAEERWQRIGELEERCEELLGERESSRAGEDSFKAQRDAALSLLRWLIGDLIENRSDV